MTPDDVFVKDLERFLDRRGSASHANYLAETLQRTSGTDQMSWWSSPERWLPVDTVIRSSRVPRPHFRTLAVAVVALIIAAVAVYAVGAQRRLPPPFGLARNGEVVVSIDGDILVVDPASGRRRTLIGGPAFDFGAIFDRSGTHLAFLRTAPAACGKPVCGVVLAVATADGSDVRELTPPTPLVRSVDWSPDGAQLAFLVPRGDGNGHSLNVVNADGTGLHQVDVGRPVRELSWRFGTADIVFRGDQPSAPGSATAIFAVHPDGRALRELSPGYPALQTDFKGLAVSWDGNLLAHMRTDAQGRFQIHILDLRTNEERVLPAPDMMAQISPAFSPDASSVLYVRLSQDRMARLVVAPVDGSTHGRVLGPPITNHAHGINNNGWSPDGTAVFANYDSDKTARLMPIDGSAPIELGSGELALVGYQRLAP